MVNDYTLVARNTKDFNRIDGLKLVTPGVPTTENTALFVLSVSEANRYFVDNATRLG